MLSAISAGLATLTFIACVNLIHGNNQPELLAFLTISCAVFVGIAVYYRSKP